MFSRSKTPIIPIIIIQYYSNPFVENWAPLGLHADEGEEVYAMRDGEVVFADYYNFDRGYTVIIKHADDLYTWYCTLNKELGLPVKKGDKVKAGQVIGYAGKWFIYDSSHAGIVLDVYNWSDMVPTEGWYDSRSKAINDWLEKPLVSPLDNVGEDFDYGNQVAFSSVISAQPGSPVYAVDDGVVYGVKQGEYGLLVQIFHNNGIITCYYYLDSSLGVIIPNTEVKAGDVIGYTSEQGLGYCLYWRNENYIEVMP